MGFDYDMIERIILNLISNAFKYSYSNGKIYINLIDEGQGIPPNKLNVIFERFGQSSDQMLN